MNNFTESAKNSLNEAETLALYSGNLVESIHLLIGITKISSGYGAQILSRLGFSYDIACSYLIKSSSNINHTVLFSPTVESIINYAEFVAVATNSAIDTHHLLLSIAYHKTCAGSKILSKHNINYNILLSIVEGMNHNNIGIISKPSQVQNTYQNKVNTNDINEANDKKDSEEILKYGVNLTQLAKENKLSKIIGREKEISRLISILCRKHKNNPIIIGESGVGKTALVEGLTNKIASGTVPEFLKNKIIYSLNMNNIVSGTKYRGEMEEKLSKIIEYAKTHKIILFIDELHSTLTAGSSDSGTNISDILKPAIANQNIRVIGATTINEYSQYIEKDPAFERRFMKLSIEEPSKEECISILEGIKIDFENHYKIQISDSAIISCVNLSARYIKNRFLPDKAIDVLDEACSKLIMNAHSKNINENDIKEAISTITGIPIYKLTASESEKLLNLEYTLNERIIGQNEAISAVAKAIRRSKAGLKEPNKPIGSFIFLGPSGVGKTETAKALTEILFGDEDSMFRFDMSEFMEKSSVSKLIGAAPGYVGYSEGGKLTEAIKYKPYSLILFDEIEKAHPDVFNLLLQVLDDGRLSDSKGKTIDFRNTLIIMTSNAGNENLSFSKHVGFGTVVDIQNEKDLRIKSLKSFLRPEFINRVDCITVFNNLSKENLTKIANNIIERKKKYLYDEKFISLIISDDVIDFIVNSSYDNLYGARPLKRKIETLIEDKLSELIIRKNLRNTELTITMQNADTVISKK